MPDMSILDGWLTEYQDIESNKKFNESVVNESSLNEIKACIDVLIPLVIADNIIYN